MKTGQAATCQFVTKLPSLKLPSLDTNNSVARLPSTNQVINAPAPVPAPTPTPYSSARLNNPTPLPPSGLNISIPPLILTSNILNHTPRHTAPPQHHHVPPRPFPPQASPPSLHSAADSNWKSLIELRLSTFDNKIDSLVDLLKMNQQVMMNNQLHFMQQQQQQQQQYVYDGAYSNNNGNGVTFPSSRSYSPESRPDSQGDSPDLNRAKRITDSEAPTGTAKKRKTNNNSPSEYQRDFRDGFLSKQEARELFQFFDTNIAQQLFGFEISKFKVEEIWETCPILVCAISTIASIHHPLLASKSNQLKGYLHSLCGSVLLTRPKSEKDAYNTIVALILCSFWLTDSQMFTGLALQLAKEYGLNQPNQKSKEKLKLWYLLYVLDGQQSLTFNRQPLLNSQEYSLKHSKELLLEDKDNKLYEEKKRKLIKERQQESTVSAPSDEEVAKMVAQQKLTDMRLVSQVEYNQALNEAFKGDAWELLAPSSFGIPSKSNLELDKWMVSWTVLLSPGNFGAVWSTKSTLIYYNFAKMHINSTAVRKLTIDPNKGKFPKWETPPATNNTPKTYSNKQTTPESEDSEDSSDDEYGDDDFISNKELVSPDEAVINANIALSAAQTVLNLVINDKDILDNLKYVPVHIHIMLYYAALLLINPPAKSNNQTIEIDEINYYDTLLNNLKVVHVLQRKIYVNLPIDAKFGNRLIKNLQDVTMEKLKEVQVFVDALPDGQEEKLELSKKISGLLDSSESRFEEVVDYEVSSDGSSKSGTPLPEKISAWPGSNHGHP
ncbi:Transcriptional activator of proteases prtT [Candida viswanathii]|uniref:Transcriptional activator of proteases prtT n=1 Tax=Candida viswanathii TaxID=5486 RepID=A0A367YEW8_9ASCO|nr:Transcriptional activator of proteases prtT [Candida viswanathii]